VTPAGELIAGFLALPMAGIGQVLGGRRAVILAPHPDDESIGCGGLIAASCAAGLPPAVVIMTDGAASHPGSAAYPPQSLARLREVETRAAVAQLGLPEGYLFFLHYPDTGLPGDGPGGAAALARVLDIAATMGGGRIIAPWAGDPHCDHQATARIGAAAAARLGVALLSYPVWGWLRPDSDPIDEPRRGGWRLDITAHWAAKQAAVAAHRSQHHGLIGDSPRGFFLPEALLAICRWEFEVYIG
jgi:LmbE family N-acetylglucosaminyl deacetylase